MLRRCVMALLLLPLVAVGADGAWHASVSGPSLGQRGNWLKSPALSAASPASGWISVVNWRYTLSKPAPTGLVVRLCASQRCVLLDGASGTTRGLAHIAADETLHMAFGFNGKGHLPAGLRVVKSEVTVNYQQ